MPSLMKCDPCVFVLESTYEIFVVTKQPCTLQVKVADQIFCDSFCGVLRSEGCVRRAAIPRRLLDAAQAYTISLTPMLQRSPYFPQTGLTQSQTFPFRPVPAHDSTTAYWISDTHGMIHEPVHAFEGEPTLPDFLLMGGDIADHCDDPEGFLSLYEIAGRLVHGSRPVLFIRGNHDTRGRSAELLPQYTALFDGKTYGALQIGSIWIAVLDAGEDKSEEHPAYGGTNVFHAYRQEQTYFLRSLLKSKPFERGDVLYRMVACHIPFTTPLERDGAEFGIEKALYAQWTELVNQIHPNLMICGHTHAIETALPGGPLDAYHQNFPVVMGAQVSLKDAGTPSFRGTILLFSHGEIQTRFVP